MTTKCTTLLLAALAGCAADAHIEPPPAWTVQQQHDAAVIIAACGGSGAIVGPGRVLTASHVACDGAEISTTSGAGFPAHHLAWRDNNHDLALLVADVTGSEAVLDAAEIGDTVCAEVTLPARQRRCGHITDIDPVGTVHGSVDLWLDIRTVPGNSGAALYDDGGHLVGVVTSGVDGIGLATSVVGRLQR